MGIFEALRRNEFLKVSVDDKGNKDSILVIKILALKNNGRIFSV